MAPENQAWKALKKCVNAVAFPHYHSWNWRRNFCPVCRRHTIFVCDIPADRWIRRCIWCRSTPKYRAIELVAERRLHKTLEQFLAEGGTIYELTRSSPISRKLLGRKGYVASAYLSDRPFGTELRPNFWNQDVQRLSFADESFHVVISSETMEHVRNPWQGFREIWRVLKPGGFHVFTIPYREDRLTTARVDTCGPENVFLLPPVYHKDPYRREDSLVYTDYGSDLPQILAPLGFRATLEQVLEPDMDIQDDLQPVRVWVTEKVAIP